MKLVKTQFLLSNPGTMPSFVGMLVLFTTGLCVLMPVVSGELYTALADMEELLETESVLIDTLHGYIKAQEQRLETLRR